MEVYHHHAEQQQSEACSSTPRTIQIQGMHVGLPVGLPVGNVVSEDEISHHVSDEEGHQVEMALQMSMQDDDYKIPTLAVVPVDDDFLDPAVSKMPPQVTETEADSQDDRIKHGMCPNCGTQLYKQKKGRPILLRRLLVQKRTKSRAKPLTIAGVVNRGQCLGVDCVGSAAGSTTTTYCTPLSPHAYAHANANATTEQAAIATDLESVGTATEVIMDTPQSQQQSQQQSSAVYHGPYNEYGQFHGGPAEFTWNNGDRYVGTFWNGQRHGQECSLFFADGSEYVGSFEHDEFHGIGTRRFSDGSVYSGDYYRGKRSGIGKYYYANGDLAVGQWSDDYMVFGKYHYANGQVYEGNFLGGLRHGRGKYTWTNGHSQVYRYEHDVRASEYGVRWNPKHTKAWKLEGSKRIKVSLDEAVDLVKAL
jgi:ribosomal protein L34E